MSKNNWSHWISLSDMMTWLMLVFLLISILVISEIQTQQENKNKILIEYNNTKEEIHKDLLLAFEEKEKEWQMTITNDLTIKFNNEDILFDPHKTNLKDWFKNILDNFIPWYLSIINNPKYEWKIKEIRIEWHAWDCSEDLYFYCLWLSQWRSNSVLEYFLNSNYYKNSSENDKSKFKFLITSNGMSTWKNLDNSWNYTYYSKNKVNTAISKRVEFKIVTNSEDLVDNLINNLIK